MGVAQAGAVQLHRFGQVVQQRGPGVVVPGGVDSLLGAGKIFAQVGEQGLNCCRRQEFGLPSLRRGVVRLLDDVPSPHASRPLRHPRHRQKHPRP